MKIEFVSWSTGLFSFALLGCPDGGGRLADASPMPDSAHETDSSTSQDSGTGVEDASGFETGGMPVFCSDVLNLERWKLTLPIDADGSDSSDQSSYDDRNNDAHEIRELVNYDMENEFSSDDFFRVEGNTCQFRAHCAGATTRGSGYPRSELRQLVGGGDNYWSIEDYQLLHVIGTITDMPDVKSEVVIAQIHGGDNEPLKVKYVHKDRKIYIIYNEGESGELTAEVTYDYDYTEGNEYDVMIIVENGNCDVYFDRTKPTEESFHFEIEHNDTGYFKTGIYTQSSIFLTDPDWKDKDEACQPDRGGETRLRFLKLIETYDGQRLTFE